MNPPDDLMHNTEPLGDARLQASLAPRPRRDPTMARWCGSVATVSLNSGCFEGYPPLEVHAEGSHAVAVTRVGDQGGGHR